MENMKIGFHWRQRT